MAAFGTSNVSRVPPSNPFDEIDAYINQLTPGITRSSRKHVTNTYFTVRKIYTSNTSTIYHC